MRQQSNGNDIPFAPLEKNQWYLIIQKIFKVYVVHKAKNFKNKKGPQEKTRGPKGETRNALLAHNFKMMATIKPTHILSQSLMKKHLGGIDSEQK